MTLLDLAIVSVCCVGLIAAAALIPVRPSRPAGVEPDEPWPRSNDILEVTRRRSF